MLLLRSTYIYAFLSVYVLYLKLTHCHISLVVKHIYLYVFALPNIQL